MYFSTVRYPYSFKVIYLTSGYPFEWGIYTYFRCNLGLDLSRISIHRGIQ